MASKILALKYPDRAESVGKYARYRVLLDHWQPLIEELIPMRHALFARGDSRTLGIYAPQGSGKTLFARQLQADIARSSGADTVDPENLWHRIASDLDDEGVRSIAATNNLKVFLRDSSNDKSWIEDVRGYLAHAENRAIVILDEADQAYFQLSLLGMSLPDFLQTSDPNRLTKAAADKFVTRCRNDLQGTLVIMLSNKQEFLNSFRDFVNGQHEDMMRVIALPPAAGAIKERVVRINTNRLNSFSYWYCINNATPARKEAIYAALHGADTFPSAFRAVDAAISNADQTRMGRPAIKNHITLFVLHEDPDTSAIKDSFGDWQSVEFSDAGCQILLYTQNWVKHPGITSVQASMLESEWNLRIVLVGAEIVEAIIDPASNQSHLKHLLSLLFRAPSPYAGTSTKNRIEAVRKSLLAGLRRTPSTISAAFWSSGQQRSSQYESALKKLHPSYNIGSTQIPGFRPDLIVSPYAACAVLSSKTDRASEITPSIRRRANFVEVTATQKVSKTSVFDYLGKKLHNYIRLMESA